MDYTYEALVFRLEALACPLTMPSSFEQVSQSPVHLQKLIAWLEDTHIRLLSIAHRTSLRGHPPVFLKALRAYLNSLPGLPHHPQPPSLSSSLQLPLQSSSSSQKEQERQPFSSDTLLPILSYLTDYAIALHYDDNATVLSTPHDPWHGNSLPPVSGASTDPDVAAAAKDLLSVLGLDVPALTAFNGDISPVDALHVVADQAEYLTDQSALIPSVSATTDTSRTIAAGGNGVGSTANVPLTTAGISSGNPALDHIAAAARILLVRRLRHMQYDVDDVVTQLQTRTADPQTNSKLGAVGR